jgi:HK97 family phage prohead protease
MSKEKQYTGGPERRAFTGKVERRAADADGFDFEGLASRVGTEYTMYEDETEIWTEEIAPGAFDDVLGDDVRILINHKDSAILGRTKSGTAKVWVDADGLRYAWKNPTEITYAADLAVSINRGDIDQSSFGFRTSWRNNKWEEIPLPDGKRKYKRTIMKFDELFDASPVTYPANPDTAVGARDFETALKEWKEQRSNQRPPADEGGWEVDIYLKMADLDAKRAMML